MRPFAIILSLAATFCAFIFYMLGLMHLEPLFISGPVFFLSLLVTVRLIFQRKNIFPKKRG